MAWAISILPTLLGLIQRLVEWGMARDLLAKGQLLAIAEASKALNTTLAKAAAAEQEAAATAASDPTDGAFDSDFFRKD
jgi:hypothetical protein